MDDRRIFSLIYVSGPISVKLAWRRYLLAQGWRRWTERTRILRLEV